MSQLYYMASPIELDVGSFGLNRTEVKELEIINSHLILINSTIEIKSFFPIDKDKTAEDFKDVMII